MPVRPLVLAAGLVGLLPSAPLLATPDTPPAGVGPLPTELDEAVEGLDTTGTPPRPPADLGPSDGELARGERRDRPDYDGRSDPPTDAGEVLVWIPRLVLLPVHAVLRYGVRVPAVAALNALEEAHVFQRVERLLTFRDGRSAVFPIFLADFGLRPSVGLSTFHRDLLREGDALRASATFWVDNWIRVTAEAETPLFADRSGHLALVGEFVTRPDQPFYGFGPDTAQGAVGYFRRREVAGGFRIRGDLEGLSYASITASYRDVILTDGQATTIGDRITAGVYPAPPGFAAERRRGAYRLLESVGRFVLDSRPQRDPRLASDPGTGILFEATGRLAVDPDDDDLALATAAFELAGFWDVTGLGHVLATKIYAEALEELGDATVPFTERPSLGGLEQMRGFLRGRFVGDSTLLVTLSYRYPIWYLVDAELFSAFGNAWTELYEGFDIGQTYMSGGLALRSTFDRQTRVELILALGTDRLDRAFSVDSVRIAFGVTEGF